MIISISNRAESNIQNIIEFTSNISTNYANRVVSKLYSTMELVMYAPYIGRYVPELYSRNYRERICENYRIIYLVKDNIIYVRYIISGRCNSNLFFDTNKREIKSFLNQLYF